MTNTIALITSKNLTKEFLEEHKMYQKRYFDYSLFDTLLTQIERAQENLLLLDTIIDAFSDYQPHQLKNIIDADSRFDEWSHQKIKAYVKKLVEAGLMERIETIEGTVKINHPIYEWKTIEVPKVVAKFKLLQK